MTLHPKLLKFFKWTALSLTLLELTALVLCKWYSVFWIIADGWHLMVTDGCMRIGRDNGARSQFMHATNYFELNTFPTTFKRFEWWFFADVSWVGWYIYVPLWFLACLSLIAAAVLWHREVTLATRRTNLCPHCHYPRSGLTPHSPCPECGALPTPPIPPPPP